MYLVVLSTTGCGRQTEIKIPQVCQTPTGKTADRSKKENHERKESYVFTEVYN